MRNKNIELFLFLIFSFEGILCIPISYCMELHAKNVCHPCNAQQLNYFIVYKFL